MTSTLIAIDEHIPSAAPPPVSRELTATTRDCRTVCCTSGERPRCRVRCKIPLRAVAIGLAILWFGLGLAGCMTGLAVTNNDGEGLDLVQALYFLVQVITTIGYGDFTPKTAEGMLFVTCHILIGSLLVSSAVSEAVDYFVDLESARAAGAVASFLNIKNDEEGEWTLASFLERYQDLILAVLQFVVSIVVWVLFYMFYCVPVHLEEALYQKREASCESKTLVEALYMAVVTLTTVGFGDTTPSTMMGKLFFTIGSLLGVASYLNLVGAILQCLSKVKQDMRLDTLSEQELFQADSSGDESVDLYEFTRFMLTRFNIVDAQVFEEIKANFQSLDKDGSGELDKADLRSLMVSALERSESSYFRVDA